MEKNCKNCAFWCPHENWNSFMMAYGECKKAIVGHYDDLIRGDNALPMMVQDGEGSNWCELITHENHYCNCWAEKKE